MREAVGGRAAQRACGRARVEQQDPRTGLAERTVTVRSPKPLYEFSDCPKRRGVRWNRHRPQEQQRFWEYFVPESRVAEALELGGELIPG